MKSLSRSLLPLLGLAAALCAPTIASAQLCAYVVTTPTIQVSSELGMAVAAGTTVVQNRPTNISPAPRPVLRRFTLKNTGSTTAHLGTMTLSNTYGSTLQITKQPACHLPADAITTFEITFNTSTAGDYPTQVRINRMDGSSFFTFNLTAKGVLISSLPGCQPTHLRDELNRAMRTGTPAWSCNWIAGTNYTFSTWSGGGTSENIAVLAAAVGLYGQPVINTNQDLRLWFRDYLSLQTGGTAISSTPSSSSTVRWFKASEMFSNVYDNVTVQAVVAAHAWAWNNPSEPRASEIQVSSRKWLKANWYAYGMATGSRKVTSLTVLDVDGGTGAAVDRVFNTPGEDIPSSANHWTPIASPRSWTSAFLGVVPLFARAQNLNVLAPGDNAQGVNDQQVYAWLVSTWTRTDTNVFALSQADRGAIVAMRDNETLPADLSAAFSGLKTAANLHFLMWGNARATVMEPSTPNRVHHEAIFAISFDNATGAARMLSPWKHHTQGAGSCSLNHPTFPTSVTAQGDGVARTLTLPSGSLVHHVLLTPTGLSVLF